MYEYNPNLNPNLTVGKSLENMAAEIESIRIACDGLDEAINKSHGAGRAYLQNLRDDMSGNIRKIHLKMRSISEEYPPPKLVCPQCGYDGEMHLSKHQKPEHGGFRMLEIVLQPRQIFRIGEFNRMELSDPTESYDPFDNISDPNAQAYLDTIDGVYGEIRKFAKGRWIILCGSCGEYFDGRELAERCQHDYTVESIEDRWGSKGKKISDFARR